jgi:Amt family ammonium transporter
MNGAIPASNSGGVSAINGADTVWVMVSSAMIMLMTPSLGFFYAGLVRQKNILAMLIQCYAIFASVSIIWGLLGFSLVFGETRGHFIGSSKYFGLDNLWDSQFEEAPTVPGLAFFFFELAACAITPALIIGASAERLSTLASLLFSCIWVIVVYCPIAHWVWKIGGWLEELGARDFGGGLPVHMSAGYAAIALSLVIGKRKETSGEMIPHNVSYVVLGAMLLWFGWFGYNGGSSFAANAQAALAIANTNMSSCAAGLSWGILEYIFKKKVTVSGIATATVCGLIAITPGSGFCPVWSSLIIGFLGGIFSFFFIKFREHYHLFDDALDVAGCHGVCGTWGVFATGLFADMPNAKGLFYGETKLFTSHLCGIVVVASYSFIFTYIICFILNLLGFLRTTEEGEEKGIDIVEHNERSYIIVQDEVPVSPTEGKKPQTINH